MTSNFEFLEQVPLFDGLTDYELDAVDAIAQEYAFEDGAAIAYQRDVANSLYLVKNGRLFARTVDSQGIVRETRSYLPGDYFGESWLFVPNSHPATVNGAGDGRLIIIDGPDILQLLNENPEMLAGLEPLYDEMDNVVAGLSEEAWNEAQKIKEKSDKKSTAVSLLADELVEYQSRRSRWHLLLQTLGPLLCLFFLFLLTPFLMTILTPGTLGFTLAIGFIVILTIICVVWLFFRILDWSNDYFVITSKHLIHREFELRTFHTNVIKISVDKIQSVEVLKPSFLANFFNIGTARVTTAAQTGVVLFDGIDDPNEVKDTLERLSQRVKALDEGRGQAIMREAVESHFQVEDPLQPVAVPEEEETAVTQKDSPFTAFRKRYAWRVIDGDTITYRKHIFFLFSEIGWALLAGFLITLVGGLVLNYTELNIWWILLLLLTLNAGWLIWGIEDWRNDTFRVTSRDIIDIDRKPFGFGVSSKQASISNIQNVNAERPGFFATLFDFGFVYVETAGATSDITFENVPHPSVIQSDIFKRLDAFEQVKRVQEGAQRRKEYAVLLDVFRQATEQNRIPRRTPPPEEIA